MKFFEHLRKKGQSGQSLVILALGFLALLGFVGIVTDVSVLFIRYSTLSRAVDAAAVAAAGQMRRVADPTPGHDEAISVANLNLAARQFIEVYGLNPKSVIVETCRAQEVGRDPNGNPIDENGQPLFNSDGSVNGAADQTVVKNYQQLCTPDELKLVRVTAQIDAPTIFLRLLGYPTVTLTDTAISQTAVLDVVLIFDVSDAMVNETTYADWDNIPGAAAAGLNPKQGVIYMPPYIGQQDVSGDKDGTVPNQPTGAWQYMGEHTETFLNTLIAPDPTFSLPLDPNIADRTIAFEPNPDAPSGYQLYTAGTGTSDQGRTAPREFCQVRGYQGSAIGNSFPDLTLREQYVTFFDWLSSPTGGNQLTQTYQNQFIGHGFYDPSHDTHVADNASDSSALFSGFVPMYNSYACCNDPLGLVDVAADGTQNMTFDNLICQPFKDARDAAHQFLDRLDFLRGDRVAFVTFDRRAQVIDPDGTNGPQASMIETQNDLPNPSGTGLLRKGADETLDDTVGVRAEYTGYADTNGDGLWDHLMNGGQPVTYTDLMDNINVGDLEDTPVQYECPFINAALPLYDLPGNYQNAPLGGTRSDPLLSSIITVPSWYYTTGNGDTNPAHNGTAAQHNNYTDPGVNALNRSYEFRASCGRGNVGAGLEAGSGTLYNEGRREGAVWVMVMLSDGAAGASNPITHYQGSDEAHALAAADPYNKNGDAYDPAPGVNGPSTNPLNPSAAGYGAFGLCPYGTAPGTVGSNDTTTGPSQIFSWTDHAPFCEDLQPETRHFCGLSQQGQPDAALDLDPNCFNFYDTDDYARDWADWVGLASLPLANTSNPNSGRVSNQLLPTIFTIGFGFNFDEDDSGNHATDCAPLSGDALYNCMRGINQTEPTGMTVDQLRFWARGMEDRNLDYLGEELMRYVADVGDNNQVDSDWWQLCESKNAPPYGSATHQSCRNDGVTNTDNRIGNPIDLTSPSPNWGPRGACEAAWTDTANPNNRGSVYMPLPPQQSCGNYYVAATGQQLEQVFDQIASRMFTRLSQ
ncbi:MAG TPA: hypothetical protein VHD90_12395 [Phototrophicaceae bacterium]|nr:hypothetical protein [Phototrophicaceae bacterium]